MDGNKQSLTRRTFINAAAVSAITAMHAPILNNAAAQAEHSGEAKPLLQKLRLSSNDLDAQEPFYREVMEFPTSRPDEKTLRITAGESTIEFVQDNTVEKPFYHVAFTIPENRVEQSLEWMTPRWDVLDINTRGEKIMDFRHWNAHSIFYLDPVGNILEFIGHHEMDNATSDPFNPRQVMYASEIGLVVPDVPATVATINGKFGYENFRGLSADTFTALGDTRGLLLIVRKGRGWLPVNTVKADVFPVEATLGYGNADDAMEFEGLPYVIKRA